MLPMVRNFRTSFHNLMGRMPFTTEIEHSSKSNGFYTTEDSFGLFLKYIQAFIVLMSKTIIGCGRKQKPSTEYEGSTMISSNGQAVSKGQMVYPYLSVNTAHILRMINLVCQII